ncbi:MAG TPA: 2OG-Fe(II) oxygenase [Acidimicrobiales bacterium]|jgi:hypothetical protein|nr:2OG-Fe(II) oxygenase [Acidimicrobiales bacterium]
MTSAAKAQTTQPGAVRRRVEACDWDAVAAGLDRDGYAVTTTAVLSRAECKWLRDQFQEDATFRSTIDMARYRFGEGRYRYYAYPLPATVAELRDAAYPPLAALANTWATRLGEAPSHPPHLQQLVDVCRAAGQTKPTPLILRYERGGYNNLHQDLYGDVAFPLQLTVALTEPGVDFTGGENLFVEQRPRAQSRGTSVAVPLGHAVIFPTRYRPVAGSRHHYRALMRHGISTVTSGVRFTLGVIFHEAR